jgi:hypothetical protein
VALWGYGYKLSLYHWHEAASQRVPVAKLWSEPRNGSLTAAVALKAKSNLAVGSQALSVDLPELTSHLSALICILPSANRGIAYFDFLIPSRSPPPQSFSLA